jgi:hypothetical protein
MNALIGAVSLRPSLGMFERRNACHIHAAQCGGSLGKSVVIDAAAAAEGTRS